MKSVSPVDREKLRMVVYKVQDKLRRTVLPKFLELSKRVLSPEEYDMVLEERQLERICAFPTCSNPPQEPKGRYRISRKDKTVYETTGIRCLSHFCSEKCLSDSEIFRASLPEDPVYLRPIKKEDIDLLLPSDSSRPLQDQVIERMEVSRETHQIDEEKAESHMKFIDSLFKIASEQKELLLEPTKPIEDPEAFTIDMEEVQQSLQDIQTHLSPFAQLYQFTQTIEYLPTDISADQTQLMRREAFLRHIQKHSDVICKSIDANPLEVTASITIRFTMAVAMSRLYPFSYIPHYYNNRESGGIYWIFNGPFGDAQTTRLSFQMIPRTVRSSYPFPIRPLSCVPMDVFDRKVKRIQRDSSALHEDAGFYDYLRDEVADRLVDRMKDIKRDFSHGYAVDIGSLGGSVGKALSKANVMPEMFLQCANSSLMIQRSLTGDNRVHTVVCDEQELPLPPRTFDLAFSCLSLQWVNDLPSTLKSIRRSLKPDSPFIAAIIGGDSLQELRSALTLADQERRGGLSPHISPMAKVRDCGSLLQGAGFVLPTIDIDSIVCPYPDAFTAMHHLQRMGEGNCGKSRDLSVSRDVFMASAAIYEQMYSQDGLLPLTFEVIYMIGWSPGPSQLKAKERGSAEKHIKEVL